MSIRKRSIRCLAVLLAVISSIGYFTPTNNSLVNEVHAEDVDSMRNLCYIENIRRSHLGEELIDCSILDALDEDNSNELVLVEEEIEQEKEYVWNGSKLTQRKGINIGPTGRETYYNLPMNGIIKIMRSIGNNEKYWVREDGVKMLGKYVMVAANLNIFPRGSLVPTSLGMGIVCDTGDFAKKNPRQLDIAVAWR